MMLLLMMMMMMIKMFMVVGVQGAKKVFYSLPFGQAVASIY